ncbi:MAG TPA: class I SAM-dependent methyltransferase [Anaerolineae bacterium]|nr:class I SAM-dependent methyltransferase [Anaerolineae bacterium]
MDFYDRLSPFYHLIYQDWEGSIERQAAQLWGVMEREWGGDVKRVLDVACGIGTQSLGLAGLGLVVKGADVSAGAVARAKREAAVRGLAIAFEVGDMRTAYEQHGGGFDVVLAADNAIPHLLSDAEILGALGQMYRCLRPGGGCVITMRDYDGAERGRGLVKPYGTREVDGVRYLVWQVWDFEGDIYTVSMYFVRDEGEEGDVTTEVMRTKYYALSPNRLVSLMVEAGFGEVKRLDDVYFQPVVVGTRVGDGSLAS